MTLFMKRVTWVEPAIRRLERLQTCLASDTQMLAPFQLSCVSAMASTIVDPELSPISVQLRRTEYENGQRGDFGKQAVCTLAASAPAITAANLSVRREKRFGEC